MDMILEALEENGPYDGLFLDLHGAMVYGRPAGRRSGNPAPRAYGGGKHSHRGFIRPAWQH